MPYTPDEQRLLDHVNRQLAQHRDNLKLWYSGTLDSTAVDNVDKALTIGSLLGAEHQLQRIKDLMEDIKATRDKEYPCDQKGE